MIKRVGLAVLVVAATVAACGGSSGGTTAAASTTAAGATRAVGSTHPTVSPPPVSSRMTLAASSVAGGTDVAGTLTVTNRTGRAIRLPAGAGCLPSWAVGLRNGQVSAMPYFAAVCRPGALVFARGTTTLPFTVRTQYTSCAGDRANVTAASPLCLPHNRMPSLPAGTYQAVLVGLEPGIPASPTVTLRITG